MADLNVAIEMIGRDNASGVVSNVVKSLGGIPEAAGKVEGLLGGLVSGFGKLGLAGMGVKTLADTVGGFATSLVSGNAEMEKYETQLGTLMGSADGAKVRLKELAEFGARTPFELPEIAAAEKVLLGFGLTGEKVFKLTGKTGEQFREVVGDIAAGTGASFQEIALTMGKFSAGATGEAISRFQEMGVATREQLAGMGIQFSKSGELLSPLPIAMQAITTLAQQKFGGGMDKLSKTFEGQMSTLSDNFNQAKVAIMAPIFDVLRDSLAGLNSFISSGVFQEGLRTFADLIANGVAGAINIARGAFGAFMDLLSTGDFGVFADDLREAFNIDISGLVGPLTTAQTVIAEFSTRIGTFFSQISAGATLAQTVNAAFGDLIPASLNPMLDMVDAAFNNVKTSVQGLITAFSQGGLAGVWQQVTAAMAEFAPTGERIQSAISEIGSALLSLVPEPVQSFVSGLVGMASGATAGASPMSTLATVINTVSGALESATRFVKDHVAVQALMVGALTAGAVAWGVSAAIQTYQKVLLVATAATEAYTAVQTALNVVLTANPIGIVVVALAALAAGLVYAYNNSEEFRRIVDEAFERVRVRVIDTIETAQNLLEIFGNVMTVAGRTASTLAATVSTAFMTIQNFVSSAMGTISGVISSGWETITGVVTTAMGGITTVVNDGWTGIGTLIGSIMGTVTKTVSDAWETVRGVIEEKTSAALTVVSSWSKQLLELLGKLKDTVLTTAQTIGQNLVEGIKSGASAVWESLVSWATQQIRDLLGKMAAAIGSKSPSRMAADVIGEPITQGISMGIQNGLPDTLALARASAQAIVQAFSLRESFVPTDRIIPFGMVKDSIRDNTQAILGQINHFNEQAKDAFLTLNHYLRGWIDDVIAHRTQLLWRFNFAAYLRGEGTAAMQELTEITDVFVRDTMGAAEQASKRLSDIARQLQADIGQARSEAMKAAEQLTTAAANQVRQIQMQSALQKEIKMQRDAFQTMQRQAKDYFDAQQNELQSRLRTFEQIAKINVTAGMKLGRVGQEQNPAVAAAQDMLDSRTAILRIDYEMARDLERAKTDDEKNQIAARAAEARQALQDEIAEEKFIYEQTRQWRMDLQRAEIEAERQNALQALADQQLMEMAVANQTSGLRMAISQRQADFDRMQVEQAAAFEQSMDDAAFARQVNQIYAERDARLQALGEALAEKEKQLTASVQKERDTVLAGLAQQLQDYKTKYIDGISAAFHHAGVDIKDFLDAINNHLSVEVDNTTRKVLDMVKILTDAKQTIGDPLGFIPQNPPLTVGTPTYPSTVIPPLDFLPGVAGEAPMQINFNGPITTTTPNPEQALTREFHRSMLLVR